MKLSVSSAKPLVDLSLLSDSSLPKMSPSQLRTYLQCEIQWDWAYAQSLKRVGPNRRQMDKGKYFHQLAHFYYQLMQQGHKAGSPFILSAMNNKLQNDMKNDMTTDNMEIMNIVIQRFSRYINNQSPIIDRGITILGVEQHLEVPVVLPSGRAIILQGFIDLIYRDRNGRIRVRDHKTGENSGTWRASSLDLESQLLFYAVLYWLLEGVFAEVVEISYISTNDWKRKKPTDQDVFNFLPKNHSQVKIQNFWENLWRTLERVYDSERAKLYRFDKDCEKCSYKPLCEAEINGTDPEPTIRSLFVRQERDYRVGPDGSEGSSELSESDTNEDFDFSLDLDGV